MTPISQDLADVLRRMFAAGWHECARMADRDDLHYDIDCPAVEEKIRLIVLGASADPALAALVEDAERYRWLRANACEGRMESRGPAPSFALNCDEPENEWDAAIDAARAESAK